MYVKASTGTKRDVIVQELRSLIIGGDLERGSRMQQDELARRFDSSITPVREALRLLEAEGLVVSEPHRGVRVASVDLERIKAKYVTRRLLESYAMQRATRRMSRRDLDLARELMDAAAAEAHHPETPGDRGALRTANTAFHFFFYDRCAMPGLAAEIAALWDTFPWDLLLGEEGRGRASAAEHQAIYDAVIAGDLEAVAQTTEVHIANGYAALHRHLTGEDGPDPFDLDVD
jgi:DNA-binding GntR family transcriptional regulator